MVQTRRMKQQERAGLTVLAEAASLILQKTPVDQALLGENSNRDTSPSDYSTDELENDDELVPVNLISLVIDEKVETDPRASGRTVSQHCSTVDSSCGGNTQSLSNSPLEGTVVEEKLRLLEHTYSTDVNSLKKQITALENIRTHMIEALDARDVKHKALIDQGELEDANKKEWVDYATNLQKDNDRLTRVMNLSAIELNELERDNDELQNRLESSEATATVADVLKKSGTFDVEEPEPPATRAQLTHIYNEMNRKESVIQQKDTKATRLIGIIRDKNDEIAQLKNTIWHQKREGWAMSGELYKLRQNQVELNNTHHNWRNYLETLDNYIYGTLLPVWTKSQPYVVIRKTLFLVL